MEEELYKAGMSRISNIESQIGIYTGTENFWYESQVSRVFPDLDYNIVAMPWFKYVGIPNNTRIID